KHEPVGDIDTAVVDSLKALDLKRPIREATEVQTSILSAKGQKATSAPLHSITSSARNRNDSGIAIPSAFAVLRLTTNSNWVGCKTGRSIGLSPLRMRPAYKPCCR